MPHRKSRTRHYQEIEEFISHVSKDMSNEAMTKKAYSVAFLQHFLPAVPKKPQLVSSADGRLEQVLFTLPNHALRGKDNPLWKTLSDLMLKMPAHTELLLLTHAGCKNWLQQWVDENKLSDRTRIITMPDYLHFTVWGEDGYVAVTDADTGRQYLMEPHSFPRFSDEMIAGFICQQTDFTNISTPLYFEGGNILIGDDFFFIGADYPVKSLGYINQLIEPRQNETRAELITRLYCENFDHKRKLIYVGSTQPVPTRDNDKFEKNGEKWRQYYFKKNKDGTVQPLFHIDMFITLLGRNPGNGKYRILVGDPRMAAELLGEEVNHFMMAEAFDNIARNLSEYGFEVIRNPLPLTYIDEPEHKERHWFFATANNALVEVINEEEKTVWLPTYGYGDWSDLKVTDEANRELFESLGFKVILLGDFIPFAENSGSVHCVKKYLRRG